MSSFVSTLKRKCPSFYRSQANCFMWGSNSRPHLRQEGLCVELSSAACVSQHCRPPGIAVQCDCGIRKVVCAVASWFICPPHFPAPSTPAPPQPPAPSRSGWRGLAVNCSTAHLSTGPLTWVRTRVQKGHRRGPDLTGQIVCGFDVSCTGGFVCLCGWRWWSISDWLGVF